METNSMGTLKERMLVDVEKVTNDIRKRREFLEVELEELKNQETEARNMMKLLRTGRTNSKLTSHEDYMTAITELMNEQDTFTPEDVINLTGAPKMGATQKLNTLTKQGVLERVERGIYRLASTDHA